MKFFRIDCGPKRKEVRKKTAAETSKNSNRNGGGRMSANIIVVYAVFRVEPLGLEPRTDRL